MSKLYIEIGLVKHIIYDAKSASPMNKDWISKSELITALEKIIWADPDGRIIIQ